MHAKTLARHVRKSDFKADPSIYDRVVLNQKISQAAQIAVLGYGAVGLKTSMLRGKAVYQLADLSDQLVARHITSNIRRVTSVKQDDRQFIVTCLAKLMAEGLPFRVYKFDIASFYESVSPTQILDRLERDTAFSGQSVRALRSLFTQLDALNVRGLPRGMSLSATLAEYLLRDMDRNLASARGVRFYARFVDDIIIITDGKEDAVEFRSLAKDALPMGLAFNKKSNSWAFSPWAKGNTDAIEHRIDFLGYRFSVSLVHRDPALEKRVRRVSLDIAPSKVRKLKTRLAKALIAYAVDNDFDILRDRVRLLTSNFRFTQKGSGARRTSGIYFNYPLVSGDASIALRELDNFLLSTLTSRHPKNRLRPVMSAKHRQHLLNLRFRDGFEQKRFFAFSSGRLAQITRCWAYA